MPVETAAAAVGKAVSKHLAVAWLASRQATRRREAELTELIQATFTDWITRRRFERQVEDISDQVTDRVLTLCRPEFGGLQENDKTAALMAVQDTLAAADLSDRALFGADLDGDQLAAQIVTAAPGVPDTTQLVTGVQGIAAWP